MKFVAICSLTFAFLSHAYGSIPKDTSILEKILSKKSEGKFSELKALGPRVYSDLRGIAFNEDRALGIRWQAFMAMVRIAERESLPEVDVALKSKDWFLRDAAIRVLPALNPSRAYNAAVAGLDDSALVVRTAAVDTLGVIKNSNCAPKLWKQLYSRENYIHHRSLWIRRHVVEALAELAQKGSEDKFIKVLDDSDSTLFAPAIKGLERLTGQSLGDPRTPPVYRRYFWKKWYKEIAGKTKKSS